MTPPELDDRIALNDPLLEPLIRAAGGGIDRELERLLVEVAQPLITQVLSRYTRIRSALEPADADDIASGVTLRLLTRLRGVRASGDAAIDDLTKYVATLTYNGFNDFMRARYPERTRLKNRLRYVLTHDPRLAVWTTAAGSVAGLSSWVGAEAVVAGNERSREEIPPAVLDSSQPANAVHALFQHACGPVMFDALVDRTAELWHVFDAPQARRAPAPPSAEAPGGLSRHLESRDMLRVLWQEISLLRPTQRKALLLNLRDADSFNVVSLVVLTGVASFDDVARILEMTPDALAAIWGELPFSDLRIGELLGLSRQQVINLRKAARERLGRRVGRS